MPFRIVRNDITNIKAHAIVNTANPLPVVGEGTDSAIHGKAGPALLEARKKIGAIRVGEAAATPAFGLDARHVIHTVGPVWIDGNHGEEALLRSCYDASLRLAVELGCRSVAFPLISSGNYGFPKDRALQIAISAFTAFLMEYDVLIVLVVYDRDSYRLSEKLFRHVESFIDENYADRRFYCIAPDRFRERLSLMPQQHRSRPMPPEEDAFASAPLPPSGRGAPMAAATCSLEDMLKLEDAGFSETLLSLIDRSGKKDSEVYKKANISKQHFSKIRNNPDYRPTKATALALALALELDLRQTGDLIGRAGYALTNSSKFDLIVRFYIEQRNFNIVEINLALYEFDQPLLGAI